MLNLDTFIILHFFYSNGTTAMQFTHIYIYIYNSYGSVVANYNSDELSIDTICLHIYLDLCSRDCWSKSDLYYKLN